MDIAWYLRRLRRMSPTEIGARLRAAAVQQAWRFARPSAPKPGTITWAGAKLPRADAALDADARNRLVAAADGVLTGRWNVFGCNFDTATLDPDWHRDVRTGITFDPTRYCFDIPFRRPDLVGDLKSLWEPSRLHHVTVLAAAYHCTGDGRYAAHAAAHLRSWWRKNPPLRGIHWLSGIEIGMRLIAFVWTRRLLEGWPEAAALFEHNPDFLLQLESHERWLAVLFSRGSSANNHLIAEAAGLFIATNAFRGTPQREHRAKLAAGILEQEAVSQTFADGLNRELAFGYHGYVLGLIMLAAIEGEAGAHPMSDDFWRIVTRMSDALAANLDEALRPPRQGDGDDAWALMVDTPESGSWAPLLDLCGAVIGRRSWWPEPKERSLLAGLAAQVARGRALLDPRPATRPNRSSEAGVTFLRGGAISCRVDHGPHGYLSTCAHAHADALSFELALDGRPLLVDPGTYCYQGAPEWRHYFRSTIAHNTLEIGAADQAVQAGAFLWSSRPTSWVESATGIDAGDSAGLTVAHDGYRRLKSGVTHFRRFRLDRADGVLNITDWIDGGAAVPVRLAFHLHPSLALQREGGSASIAADGVVLAVLDLPAGLAWVSHRGEENPPLGWFSPEFGEKVPAVALVGSGTLAPGQHLETRIAARGAATEQDRQAVMIGDIGR